jgi:L-alanine-DL-glutamate epimerase-like enolase superfamily enzyme
MFIQEMVRAFYYGWYNDLVTALPPVNNGFIGAPEGPGLGMKLDPAIFKRLDARIRRTEAKDL